MLGDDETRKKLYAFYNSHLRRCNPADKELTIFVKLPEFFNRLYYRCNSVCWSIDVTTLKSQSH